MSEIFPTMQALCSSLVQSVERRTVNPYVAGSSPAGGAKRFPPLVFCFWSCFICLLL